MRLLRGAKPQEPTVGRVGGASWIEVAESIGDVEITRVRFKDRMQCRIDTGKWGIFRVQVWGMGHNSEDAARAAVAKARACGDMLPPHPDDCE